MCVIISVLPEGERAAMNGEKYWKQIWNETLWFLKKPQYTILVILTAVFSYGFRVVTPSIGIDDTAVELYLQDGLEVVMGRWTVFLLNKVFHMAEYAPFLLELVGVLFLTLGATLFCVLLKRCLGGQSGKAAGYVLLQSNYQRGLYLLLP